MPKDTLVVATEEEHKFAQQALHGGKTDVRILYKEWTEQVINNDVYGCYVEVQSMYPFVQYTQDMPSVITEWMTGTNLIPSLLVLYNVILNRVSIYSLRA